MGCLSDNALNVSDKKECDKYFKAYKDIKLMINSLLLANNSLKFLKNSSLSSGAISA